jgi:hypothetical protein
MASTTPYVEATYRWYVDIIDGYKVRERGTGWWWLRSNGFLSNQAAYVHRDGGVDVGGDYVGISSVSVRPALWLNL